MAITSPGDVEEEQGTLPEAAPLSVAEQARLDQIETGLREGDTAEEPQQQTATSSGKTSGSKWSPRKKLLVGGGIGGFAATVVGIIFFLLLFKNIHIKNLFIAAEFASFNSAFGNRLEQAVNDPEAQPAANSDGLVQPTDSPEQTLDKISSTDLDELKGSPEAMDQAITQTESLDQDAAIGGTTASEVDPVLGIDDSIASVDGESDTQIQTDTDTAITDEVNQGLDPGASAPDAAVSDAVTDTDTAIAADATSTGLASAAQAGFARGLSSVTSTLSGPFVTITIACIARDIFAAPGHIITAIRFQGLARSAATVNKYADCQKQSKCSLPQVADIAQKFDNSSQSFTQSCAYLRDSGEVGSNCTELDSNYQVIPSANSIPDALVSLSNALDGHINIPIIGSVHVPIDTACSILLKPAVQAIAAVVNVGGATVAAASGVADFGLSDVAIGAVEGGSAVLATTAGKALAVDAALYYGGKMFDRNFSPPDWGNLMGGGDKAMATAGCVNVGCRQLTPQENTALELQINQDVIKQNRAHGLAWQLFSPENPTSTMGLVVDKMPSSPQAATAAIGQFFGTVLSPSRITKAFFGLINPIRPAWAADVQADTYGIPDYGFTNAELSQWGVVENSRWVQQNIIDPAGPYHAQQAGYDKCFNISQTKISDLLTNDVGGCDSTTMQTTAMEHYRIYKLDQRVTQDLALLNNDQAGVGGTNSPGPTTAGGCVNPFTDPAWGLSRTDEGVDYNSSTPLPVYAICNGTIQTVGPAHGWPGPNWIIYKLTSGPAEVIGKCIYVSENVQPVPGLGTTIVNVQAGQQIATTIPGSPNTEWGWATSLGVPSTPYNGDPDGTAEPGGKAFARFIHTLGGPVRDNPDPTGFAAGPLFAGTPCP